MKQKKITLEDIAKLSGVSRATVTAVLRDGPGVREKTRNLVLETIREQDYHSRLIAPSMLGRLSRMIAMIIADFDNPFFTEMLRGANSFFRREGYHVLSYSTGEDYEEEEQIVNELNSYHLAGYMILTGQEHEHHNHIKKLVEARKPLITIGSVPDVETHSIYFANREGARSATDFVIAKGHRRITCIAGPAVSVHSRERVVGYVESLAEHGMDYGSCPIVRAGLRSRHGHGYDAAMQILTDVENRPTALICFNDIVAIGVYKAAHELGLRIPEDVSVVGFDDIPMAELLGPPLTTVSLFPEQAGAIAAEALLSLVRGESNGEHKHIDIQTQLIERASVCAL